MSPFISFNIQKRFPNFALDCAAEFSNGATAVFGPSGSGKTTLLDSIAGMTSPDAGRIVVGDIPVFSTDERIDLPPERRRFGYVFQRGALFPHMTVRQNVLYGYKLTPPGSRRLDPENVCALLGVERLMDRRVTNLSGGERQRVALARALASSPRLLLLDEPVASLDAASRATIITYLKRVSDRLQTPMVFVSHSLSEVMALAPYTLALRDGSAVTHGPTAEVMAHPGVAAFADYSTLENILEARITGADPTTGTSTLRVGDIELIGPALDTSNNLAPPIPTGDRVTLSIRAGDIILSLGAPPMMSARNAIPATIRDLRDAGGRALVYFDIGANLVAEVTPAAASELRLRPGIQVHLVIKSNSILVF